MASSSSLPSQDSSSQDATSVLRSASFSRSQNAVNHGEPAPTASDLLAGAFDPAKLHPMADLRDKLEYLTLDDDKTNDLPGADTALPSRGWSDDLCYGTGTTYLSGLGIGGLWGLREGARRPLAIPNARLRLNSVLNSVTRRGTFMGNSAGVLALVYNAINSSIDHARGKHDVFGSMAAGGLSGALYKSTAGVRPALAAATLMTGLAGVWSYVKKASTTFRLIHIRPQATGPTRAEALVDSPDIQSSDRCLSLRHNLKQIFHSTVKTRDLGGSRS